ncbi:MAG: MFS transporter [Ardenticatenaceae bacterium]
MSSNVATVERSRLVEQSPVYYGWVILVVGTLAMIMSSPGQTYSVSIFIEHFIEDLGLSRSLVSSLYSVGTITGSLALPAIGRQIDKRGARKMVVMISILLGLACIYMGIVQNALMLGVGFIAIRMLGQGGMSLISRYVINQWWVKRRGTVLGISVLFASVLGLGAFPNLINWLIPRFGWRLSFQLLGAFVMAVMVPVGLIFFRNRPELYGLLPDGGGEAALRPFDKLRAPQAQEPSEPEQASEESRERLEENWTLSEVVRTNAFWLIALGVASFSMLVTGITFHMVSIFADNGLSADMAAAVFLPMSITNALMGLLSGVLIDRIPAKYMLSVGLIIQVVALLMATSLSSPTIVLLYGVMIGLTSGLAGTIQSVIWANYYGRQNLGVISGVTATIGSAASGLGPLWFGVGRDLAGSYVPALLISAVIPLVLAVLVLFIRRPRREEIRD